VTITLGIAAHSIIQDFIRWVKTSLYHPFLASPHPPSSSFFLPFPNPVRSLRERCKLPYLVWAEIGRQTHFGAVWSKNKTHFTVYTLHEFLFKSLQKFVIISLKVPVDISEVSERLFIRNRPIIWGIISRKFQPIRVCLLSFRQHLSSSDRPEDQSEDNQNCSVMYYVPQLCAITCAHIVLTDVACGFRFIVEFCVCACFLSKANLFVLSSSSCHWPAA